MGHFLQITIARKTLPFLKKNYTISPDHKLQNRATFCKLRSQEKLYHFLRKPIQFLLIANYRNGPVSGITITRKAIHVLVIRKWRNGPLSENYDRKKNFTISQEKLYNFSWSQIAEMGQFLQIMMARKSRPFLKKTYTISHDRELQKWFTFCKLRSQEKLDHFSRKTIQFLLIANCRIGPYSANYDHKKSYTISPDRKLQNRATFCKLRSQEKLYHFSRKPIQFLLIANCRNGPVSVNNDRKKN